MIQFIFLWFNQIILYLRQCYAMVFSCAISIEWRSFERAVWRLIIQKTVQWIAGIYHHLMVLLLLSEMCFCVGNACGHSLTVYVYRRPGKLNSKFIQCDLISALQDVEKCKQPACMRDPTVKDRESLLGAVVLALLSCTCYQQSVRNRSRKILLFMYTFIMRLYFLLNILQFH